MNTNKYAKVSDYNGRNLCKMSKMTAGIEVVEEANFYKDKAITFKDVIAAFIKGELESTDTQDVIEAALEGYIDGPEKTESQIIKDATQDLYRYFKAEEKAANSGRKLVIPERKELKINNKTFFWAPDAIAVSGNTYEAIVYKSGKPQINKKTGYKLNALEKMGEWFACFMGLMYLKEVMPKDGEDYQLVSNMYYMRKSTDSPSKPRDLDFFSGTGGNVCGLTEVHNSKEDHSVLTEIEKQFYEYMDTVEEGIECSQKMCDKCWKRSMCHYVNPPKRDLAEDTVDTTKVNFPLNEEQQAVIDHILSGQDEVILVDAGAGTGKTTVLKTAYASLIGNGVDPKHILSISYTDASVGEMKERYAMECLEKGITLKSTPWVQTFHAFAFQQVQKHSEIVGLSSVPEMLQDDIKRDIIEKVITETEVPGINYGAMQFNSDGSTTPEVVILSEKIFDIIKEKNIDTASPDALDEIIPIARERAIYHKMSDQSILTLLDLFKDKYQKELSDRNLMEYSDMIPLFFQLDEKKPDLFEKLGIEYIFVDEFQDTNEKQVEILRNLTNTTSFKKLVVVGDADQAIFSFQDATPEFILHFDQYIGKTVKTLKLTENHRSDANICVAANELVATNKERLLKTLKPTKPAVNKVIVRGYHNKQEEVKAGVDFIEYQMKKYGYKEEDFCIICATNTELLKYAAELSERGHSWIMKNPMNLLENSRVKAALSLADAFYEPETSVHYFDYLSARFGGKKMLETLSVAEINQMMEEMQHQFTNIYLLDIEQQKAIYMNYIMDLLEAQEEGDELYEYFIELLKAHSNSFEEMLSYTRVFKKYGYTMKKKLTGDYVGVTLVTAHSSKGLEWPVVINSITEYDNEHLHAGRNKVAAIEERRRLLFVSMTRAREKLFITSQYISHGTKKDGYVPNMFLPELMAITGDFYDPVDHEKEAAEEAKKAAKKTTRKSTKASSGKSSNEMTEEEKAEYERLVATAEQTCITDLLSGPFAS